MPRALPGSSAPGNVSSAPAGNSPRSDNGGNGDRRDFDAMLKTDAGNSAKPAEKNRAAAGRTDPAGKPDAPAAASGGPPADDNGKPSGTDGAGEPAGEPMASTATATTGTEATPAEDTDNAPWPPFGLAGLALIGLDAPPAPVIPPVPAPGAAAATDPLLASASSAAPSAVPAPALPGVAAPATAAAPAAAIALPADAQVSTDPQLLKTVTDALVHQDGGDAPAPPLLHALHAAAEIKASAISAAFTGSPTATPDVGADDFGDAMSARIGWLADQKIGHAVIRVTPHDLGQIEVRLQIDGDKVHASFSSAHAEVRHALETNMPRLRDMLGEQGFQLGNADVGQQHTAQDGRAGNRQGGVGGGDGEPALADVTVSPGQLMRQRGLVDAYA